MITAVQSRSISLRSARDIVEHAVTSASQQRLEVCVAVVDRACHLLTYLRMDRAPLLCGQIAQDKAYTVAAFGLPSHEWWAVIRDEPALLHGFVKTDRLIVYGGGAPIIHDGELVGAIGVSGGSPDQDREIAEAAARFVAGEARSNAT